MWAALAASLRSTSCRQRRCWLPPSTVCGTKVKLAAQLGRWQGVGHDLVNHCANDILVQNARPLFFLDYIAASQLDPTAVAATVSGMAAACRAIRLRLDRRRNG